jgi:hypothetical protein
MVFVVNVGDVPTSIGAGQIMGSTAFRFLNGRQDFQSSGTLNPGTQAAIPIRVRSGVAGPVSGFVRFATGPGDRSESLSVTMATPALRMVGPCNGVAPCNIGAASVIALEVENTGTTTLLWNNATLNPAVGLVVENPTPLIVLPGARGVWRLQVTQTGVWSTNISPGTLFGDRDPPEFFPDTSFTVSGSR